MKTAREQFDDIAEALCEAQGYAVNINDVRFVGDLYSRWWHQGDDMPLSDEEAARLREIGSR